jgi:HD-like signal output (HDOD) protein
LANLTPALKELALVMEGDINDLSGALEYMPAMDRFIIALSNTPFFQPEEEVTKRKKALRTLGMGLSRNLVLTGMMIREHGAKSYEFDWHPLWQHSISVGLVSTFLMNLLEEDAKRVTKSGSLSNLKDKYLTKLFTGNLSQQAYFQGLVHDIGKMLLAEIGAYPYFVAVRRSIENQSSLAEEEKKVMGVDHMEAGSLWLQRQGFDSVTREVAGNHRTDVTKASPLCCAVALSNQIVKRHGLGFSGNGVFERRDFGELPVWLELKKHFNNKITTMETVEANFIPMVGQLPLLEPIDG